MIGWFDNMEEILAATRAKYPRPARGEEQVKPGDLIRMESGGREFTFKVTAVQRDGDNLRLEGEVIEE